MGKRWALAFSSPSFPSPLSWAQPGSLFEMQVQSSPACKPFAGLAQNLPRPAFELSWALGGSQSIAQRTERGWEEGRENRGLTEQSGVQMNRAGPKSASYSPAGTPQPSPSRFSPQPDASSHAQRSRPSRPTGDHASVPKWAEAAGRGGPQRGSLIPGPGPRPAPADPGQSRTPSRGPVQPRLQRPRRALHPRSLAQSTAARQVGGAAQREACAAARVFVCVFRGCVCRCSAGQCVCPVGMRRCGGCTSRSQGRKEVSAGLQPWGGRGPRASAAAPGFVPIPTPAPRRRAPQSPFPSSDALGFNPRGLTCSSPSLPHNFPLLFPSQPSTHSIPQPLLGAPIPRPWRLGKGAKAKAESLPGPSLGWNRGPFSGLLALGVCVRGAGGGEEIWERMDPGLL